MGDPGVAEDDLRVACRDAEGFEQRCDRVPHVVKLDEPDVVLASQMRRKDRTKFRGSIGRPVRVVKTRSVSGQAEPISTR